LNKDCTWEGTLDYLEKHQSKCLFALTNCSGCKVEMIRSKIPDHQANDCEFRKVTCDKCEGSYIFIQKSLHDADCMTQCDKPNCTWSGPRKNLKTHQGNVDSNVMDLIINRK